MGKRLSEMTLEELWMLFPIVLTEHQAQWEGWYLEEASMLAKVLPPNTRISHIGSTAISSIWAKPIIDVLVEVAKETDFALIKKPLVESGYICMSESSNRLSFNKGYTENGFAEKVYHLHLRYMGDHDELYFRDYLMEHPEIACAYEQMKRKLWQEFEHDRDAYTYAKTDFVKKYTNKAKKDYKDRYQ